MENINYNYKNKRMCFFIFRFLSCYKILKSSRVYQVIQFSSLLFVRTQQIPICNTIFLIRKICHADARARTHNILSLSITFIITTVECDMIWGGAYH